MKTVSTSLFISYPRNARSVAGDIGQHLSRAGFQVWQDIKNIRHTERWSVAINDALRTTDRLVLLLTPDAMESEEVFNEWFFFYRKRKPIHCLMVESCEPHYQLLPFQYLRWESPTHRDWEQLKEELRAPFTWPALARKERVVQSVFAPARSLPQAMEALEQTILDSDNVVALSPEQIEEVRSHRPHNEKEYLLSRFARWCEPQYQLEERFVRLTLLLDQGEHVAIRWIPHRAQPPYRTLNEILCIQPGYTHVLLGAPGAGKTTQLRRLEMDVAAAGIRDPDSATIPFCVSLSEYGVGLSHEATPSPFDWLTQRWSVRYPDLPSLLELLQKGRVLLLLDALNEMVHSSTLEFRQKADRWRSFLYSHVRDCPGNRAIITCRSLDYGGVLSSKEEAIPQIRLEPMSRDQIIDYVEKNAFDQATMILEALDRDPRQLELFRNPLMLKMLIQRVKADGYVPFGRADTFVGFIRHLLHREVLSDNPLLSDGVMLASKEYTQLRTSDASPRERHSLPTRGLLIESLSNLAYAMQDSKEGEEKGSVVVDYDDACEMTGAPKDRQDDAIKVGCDLTVLEELYGQVRFFHQLFQEFFAAIRFASLRSQELSKIQLYASAMADELQATLKRLSEYDPLPLLPNTGWEETAVLSASLAKDEDAFVRGVAGVNLPLAARCASQPDVSVSGQVLAEIANGLVAQSTTADADVRIRIAAGLALGELGDPRLQFAEGPVGKYAIPDLVEIPALKYSMGTDSGAYASEGPRHTVEIPRFELGRWPVTNAEYSLFIAAGGYDEDRWWRSSGAKAWLHCEDSFTNVVKEEWIKKRDAIRSQPDLPISLLKDGHATAQQAASLLRISQMSDAELEASLRKQYFAERPREPAFWQEERFRNPSCPVVGVSWYEASAYCEWLAEQSGMPIRLPTENEWEAAAAGCSGRSFPWGEKFEVANANTFEIHIRGTTPLGVFPEGHTPEGLFDMAGNVFEWVASILLPYPNTSTPDGTKISPRESCVCRGGSWRHNCVRSRCSYRGRGLPFTRNDDLGFRLCRAFDDVES